MAVDQGIAPLGVGGKQDAGGAGAGVETPGDVSLAVELELTLAGEDGAAGRIAGDGVGGGRATQRSGPGAELG